MVNFSGNLPLHVYAIERARIDSDEDAAPLDVVLRVSQRIAHAKFSLSQNTIDLLFSQGKDAFPRLVSLSIHSAMFWAPPELLFPDTDFPALRELECHNLFRVISLSTITSPLLRSLRLIDCETTLKEQMLPLLRQLPGLEELVLERALHNYALERHMVDILTSPPDPLHTAALPHLKVLRIDEDWGDLVVMFIKYLSFPRSASVTLQIHHFSHFDRLSATYLSVLLVGLAEATPQTLLVSCDTGSLTISLWDACLSAGDALKPRVVPPRFSCALNSPPAPFITDLISSLPLHHISSAYLVERFVGLWYVPDWASLLARTPALQVLSLCYEVFDSVLPSGARYRVPPTQLLGLSCLKSVEICEMQHRSAAIPNFDPTVAHLGVVAAALQSHAGIDVKKRREDLHEGRECLCGGQSESRIWDDVVRNTEACSDGR
ncbi:hypothetical protein PsYK624_053350 [Phanerochaete sordida]|uniref:F-box domain-containing protein n=1 Tax=Phanerochaete sordida TaxID=48140 RepID=A0A9P3G8B3_9APHY|nr:hypothetical protein PsYK624_053350 [Phanerochaete sordida]